MYTLAQFADSHAEHAQQCTARLAEFSDAVYGTVEGACRDALIQLQQHLETLTVKTDAADSSHAFGASMSGGHSTRLGHSLAGEAMGLTNRTLGSVAGGKAGENKPQQLVSCQSVLASRCQHAGVAH